MWNISEEERHLMLSEIGDILWQTAGLAKVMGVTLEEVAEENLANLPHASSEMSLPVMVTSVNFLI